MAYLVGVLLAIGVSMIFGRWLGLDRDRAFYPTVLVVVASYYSLFAIVGASNAALLRECAAASMFVLLVVLGFRRNLWWVVLGLVGHGLFDFVHGYFIDNPGLPAFWPPFCAAYDIVAGIILAVLLRLPSGVAARPRA